MHATFVEPSWIRAEIVRQILQQFQADMPIYREMIGVANAINARAGESEAERLGKIMHAAIRCASNEELRTIVDVFRLMGCVPVNYYDLREQVSVESTAFRPATREEIEKNGFRVFCSRLSLECIPAEHREFVSSIVARRRLFDDELLGLIDVGNEHGGFDEPQARQFVRRCVKLFSRPQEALVSLAEYDKLRSINKVACQILVSNALAFNHLTPSVASVPAAHEEMLKRGIKTIPVWQGPVGKDVVLRQTSCLAPAIELKFPHGDGSFAAGKYQETFVEFEERLQALTPQGRQLFEEMFEQGIQSLTLKESDPGYADHYYAVMRDALASFPSDPLALWDQRLAYFTVELNGHGPAVDAATPADVDRLVHDGTLRLAPQQYEDFFGPAATNIFNSNIGLEGVSHAGLGKLQSQQAYETALGGPVVNMYDYYERIQAESLARACGASPSCAVR